jgi:hypothetical protein
MWETPKTDWKNSDAVNFETTFQRIESNIAYLYFLVG